MACRGGIAKRGKPGPTCRQRRLRGRSGPQVGVLNSGGARLKCGRAFQRVDRTGLEMVRGHSLPDRVFGGDTNVFACFHQDAGFVGPIAAGTETVRAAPVRRRGYHPPFGDAPAGAADRRRAGAGAGSLDRPLPAQGGRQPTHRLRLMEWPGGPRRSGGRPVADPRPADAVAVAAAPAMHFGDAYAAGRLEVEGELAKMLEAVYRAEPRPPAGPLRTALGRWLRRARSNTLAGSRANIHHHYDIGDDFYRLWLDEQMLYTCATFPPRRPRSKKRSGPRWTTSAASCGCGRAKRWSRRVAAGARWPCTWPPTTASPSRPITSPASRSSMPGGGHAAEGLDGRVQFIEDDYRHIRGPCDVFVSVGMLEHVGPEPLRRVGRHHRPLPQSRRPRPDPLHRPRPARATSTLDRAADLSRRLSAQPPRGGGNVGIPRLFRARRGKPPPPLRRDAAPLAAPLRRRRRPIAQMFDEPFVRAWRLYLTGSMVGFSTGACELFQCVLTRPGLNDIPRSRAGLYAETSP